MTHVLHELNGQGLALGAPIKARIHRFDPGHDTEPHFQEYTVPYRHRMSVLTLLREIHEKQDPTLGFGNQQCGRGICGVCQVRVDGKAQKGCRVVLQPGSELVITPYNEAKVIRDLVVDL